MRTQLFGVGVYLLLALGLDGQSYTPPEWKHKPIEIPVALPALVGVPGIAKTLLAAHVVRWQRLDIGPYQADNDPRAQWLLVVELANVSTTTEADFTLRVRVPLGGEATDGDYHHLIRIERCCPTWITVTAYGDFGLKPPKDLVRIEVTGMTAVKP